MTKAQKVRMNRLEAINALSQQAKEIFDWILDLMDEDTKQEIFEPISLRFCTNLRVIERFKNIDEGGTEILCCYVLKKALPKYSRIKIFTTLKDVVEQEEGFNVIIEKDPKWEIIAHVVIE